MENVITFLTDLAANNQREWMQENKKRYEVAKLEFKEIVSFLLEGIGTFDETVQGLEPKDCIFRINRDIRFSKDKSPYKTNFGAAMMEGGKKTGNPTYYLHVQPGKSFVAGGVYMPDAENLKKIRQEIDYNSEELRNIVKEDRFRKLFGQMTGESLKTAPKGYPKDHPNIDLLRMKSFLVTKDLSDKDVLAKNFIARITEMYQVMYPFNQYFSVAMS